MRVGAFTPRQSRCGETLTPALSRKRERERSTHRGTDGPDLSCKNFGPTVRIGLSAAGVVSAGGGGVSAGAAACAAGAVPFLPALVFCCCCRRCCCIFFALSSVTIVSPC